MICYRDTTYCISPDCKNACGRQLTEKVKADAAKWWGNDGAPIAVSYFCGEPPIGERFYDEAPKPCGGRES